MRANGARDHHVISEESDSVGNIASASSTVSARSRSRAVASGGTAVIERARRPARVPFAGAIAAAAPPTNSRASRAADRPPSRLARRSEEHTSELQSLMRNSYAVFCLKNKNKKQDQSNTKVNNNIPQLKPNSTITERT